MPHAPLGMSVGRRLVARGAVALAACAGLPARAQAAPTFPLRVAASRRHLEGANGQPFLMQGDTAWSLIAQLRIEEAEDYLSDRRARGFNTILVNLLEHRFATRAPANIYGDHPFRGSEFGVPHEAYFAHAERVLRRAAAHGFLVLLAPAYLGVGGSGEGWYRSMLSAGEARLRAYGEYVGRRFGGLGNIMWVHAGDYDPPRRSMVTAVVEGIRQADRTALHTAHCAPETAAAQYWGGEAWLDVDNVYTYRPVIDAARQAWQRRPQRPFFLIESTYENEHGATPERLRAQAYQALLGGACGQVFGNNPIWHFDTPGAREAPVTWRQALDGPGTRSMEHMLALYGRLPWWRLRPDGAAVLPDPSGEGQARQSAAVAEDRSLALIHAPAGDAIVLDRSRLAGSSMAARWFDPASGRRADARAVRGAADRLRFEPPGPNAAGARDWILQVSSHAG